MRSSLTAFLTVSLLASVLFILGCSESAGPLAAGQAVLLSAEPEGCEGIDALKSSMMTGLNPDGTAILVGRVGSGEDESWDPDKAAFMVRDLALQIEKHDDGHGGSGHDDCAFCKAAKEKALESMALVQVVDEDGGVIQIDARKLLGLKEDQVIVAEGQGVLEDGTLVFNAKKVFIRPES